MWQLILTNGNKIRLAEQNVSSLVNWVSQHQATHSATVGGFEFCLHRRVSVQLRLGDEGQEGEHQLVERRNVRVIEDRRTLRINTGSNVVGNQTKDAFTNWANAVTVRDHLIVGNQNPRFNATVLQQNTVTKRTEVMTEVQVPGRSVAGQDTEASGIFIDS